MSRFNFTNLTLSDAADVRNIMDNFNKIEQNAVTFTDLEEYQQTFVIELEANLYLTDGSLPSLDDGYYYVGEFHVYVNGTIDTELDGSIISIKKSGTDCDIVRAMSKAGSYADYGLQYYENVWSSFGLNYVRTTNIVTSINSSSRDNQVPSARLLYNQLQTKENTSNKTSTLSASSTTTQYPNARTVFNALGVIRTGSTLSITDGSVPNLTSLKYYYISGLNVNGVTDNSFAYSVIFFWNSGSTYYIELIHRYNGVLDNGCSFAKRYVYSNGTWKLADDRTIQYSSTDLTPGVSTLSTGSFYAVYE